MNEKQVPLQQDLDNERLDLLQQLHAQLGVGHFAAAEAQGHLDLVAFLDEAVD